MQQPCTWRTKKKVEYTVACMVFMGGRCACALAQMYFKNNLFTARPRAVELKN